MTTVTFKKEEAGYKIVIEGHANYNPGNDIVCAACSMLGYTLDNTLSQKGITYHTQISDGYMAIEINEERAMPYIEMALIGYITLEASYPENVKVISEIVRNLY